MAIKPEVALELRAMLRDGVSVSRLIRHIHSRHNGEDDCLRTVAAYFGMAFFVPEGGVRVPTTWENFFNRGLLNAQLNRRTLHELIRHKAEWAPNSDKDEVETSWLASLVATDFVHACDESKPDQIPELSCVWPTLDGKAKNYIESLLGQITIQNEKLLILSRLVERLQEKLLEWDEHLG